MAGQRVLLIRGLMDYLPGISPMISLQARLTSEGYNVTTISHLTDGFYKNAYWDAVIGHSQGAIDALRDAPELARYNPQVTIVTIDPPRTSILFGCVPGARYLNLHTREFGLGGGSLSCPQAQNVAMGGVAHHAAHAVRRTGPNYRLFTSGRSRRSRAHSCGSSVDRVRASTATCGRRVNAKVECNLRLGSRLHQHSAGRCHLYEKIAVTRHILWTASFEGRVLRSTWVSYADIWRRANSVSLIERQRSAARTSAPNISFNG
jgi:hypothetical protein